jgi:hypothetical protein
VSFRDDIKKRILRIFKIAEMDRLPIMADPVMWSDEQLIDAIKTPHLREELEKKPELLKAVLEQIAKRKGAKEQLTPKDIGEWKERGWFFLISGTSFPGIVGLYRNKEDADLAIDRIADMFGRGELPEHLIDRKDISDIILHKSFKYYQKFDGKEEDLLDFRQKTYSDITKAVDEFITHPFYSDRRKELVRKTFKTMKAPQSFDIDPKEYPPVSGAIPTEEDKTNAIHASGDKTSYGGRIDDLSDVITGGEDFFHEIDGVIEEEFSGKAKQIAGREKMKEEGQDPEKMTDDVHISSSNLLSRLLRIVSIIDNDAVCRQGDLLLDRHIERRSYFEPSDKTKAPHVWRRNMDYSPEEESPYFGNVDDFKKRFPGGITQWRKWRERTKKQRDRKLSLASLMGNDIDELELSAAWKRDDIRNDLEVELEQLKVTASVNRMKKIRSIWRAADKKDDLKVPKEFVKYWSELLKRIRKSKGKKD